jgi:hypothetical protein
MTTSSIVRGRPLSRSPRSDFIHALRDRAAGGAPVTAP